MTDKGIEIMKKIIEDRKKKSSEQGSIPRSDKKIGGSRKAHKNNKSGGLFDK